MMITGASSGIGRAIAERAASDGARIALVARRKDRLDEVADAVRSRGGEAHVIVCDVADRHAALACVAETDSLLGGVDVAIINAGVGRHRMFVEHDLEDAEHLLRVNVLGALYFAHALAPRMLARGEGWLVFMASVAGLLPVPGEAVYTASKFALVGLGEALSIELEPHVQVLTVCPGAVRGEFVKDDELDCMPESAKKTAIDPEEVARATFEALAEGKTRVIVPAKLGVAVALRGVAPSLVRSGTARVLAPILEAREGAPMKILALALVSFIGCGDCIPSSVKSAASVGAAGAPASSLKIARSGDELKSVSGPGVEAFVSATNFATTDVALVRAGGGDRARLVGETTSGDRVTLVFHGTVLAVRRRKPG